MVSVESPGAQTLGGWKIGLGGAFRSAGAAGAGRMCAASGLMVLKYPLRETLWWHWQSAWQPEGVWSAVMPVAAHAQAACSTWAAPLATHEARPPAWMRKTANMNDAMMADVARTVLMITG